MSYVSQITNKSLTNLQQANIESKFASFIFKQDFVKYKTFLSQPKLYHLFYLVKPVVVIFD